MNALWKYCGSQQLHQFLESLELIPGKDKTSEEKIRLLYMVSSHVQDHYCKCYKKKADGTRRVLLMPDPFLKEIQRRLLHCVLDRLPISSAAAAYYCGASVAKNAVHHVGKRQILKLDIKDFFGNITAEMVYQKAFPSIYFPPQAAALLTALCCYDGYLPQGAPTSAAISNLVMKDFDSYMETWCADRNICYTRYCDDMVFSGAFDWVLVKRKVRSYLNAMGFELNSQKTCVARQGQKQLVTGVTVNEKAQAPKDYRKKLRQEIYYCRKFGATSHLERIQESGAQGKDVSGYLQQLLGKVNFVLQVNPQDSYFLKARAWILEQI